MKMRTNYVWIILCALWLPGLDSTAQSSAGIFDAHQDIGNPRLKGDLTFAEDNQTYLVKGAGKNIWGKEDQFHFAWKKIKGDFMIQTRLQFSGDGKHEHRKIGLMLRDALTASARTVSAALHGDGLTSLQFRSIEGADMEEVKISTIKPLDLQLERTGNVITLSAAAPGENYKSISRQIALNEEVYAGIYICSHDEETTEQALFSNVRIVIPPPANYTPYKDYIGSHLEVMQVGTGLRKILLSVPYSLQAPNWTPDNRTLIYNANGKLYKYSLASREVIQLNTGGLDNNNNDHVLSMDGKWLGISHHVNGESTIFVLPSSGSDKPEKITSETSGASYLHGWSPDNKSLLFTGMRNKVFDIYSVNISTKQESRLTNNPVLDDGPEYTPDGKYIYFNSVRTGTMKIWRMKPDGTEQEQITFDEYNDWFPHISPDGKWIVYLSFPKDIDPSTHPFYKQVYLRLMPASGGVPRTIAYLYGGQGTINVPSWSPDSQWIAFVSNSRL